MKEKPEDGMAQPTPASQAPENPAVAPLLNQRPALGAALGRAFRHRNFRLFFAGQAVSIFGTWMQAVALGWLVYRLTDSPAMLGIVTFASQGPIFFLATIAGPLADRWDRRTIIIITQCLSLIQALALAVLTLTGAVEVPMIIALALMMGLLNAVDTPARQSFLVEMVGREDLRQVIAVNSMMFNFARMAGPAIAGIVVAAAGEGPCFLINAMSYAAVICSLAMMKLPKKAKRPPSHLFDDFKQGFVYVTRNWKIRTALLMVAAGSGFGMPVIPLMPAFAREVLQVDSQGYGYLISAFGVGAFSAGLVLARLPESRLPLMQTATAIGFGIGLILFANSGLLAVAIAVTIPMAFGSMMMAACVTTYVQTLSQDHMRGRVMSFYTTASQGTQPWGALLLGGLASQIGIANAIMLGGFVVAIAGGLAFATFKRHGLIRPRRR